MNNFNAKKIFFITCLTSTLLLSSNLASAHNHTHGMKKSPHANTITSQARRPHQADRRNYRREPHAVRSNVYRPVIRDVYPHAYYNNRYLNYYAPQPRVGLHDVILDIMFLH